MSVPDNSKKANHQVIQMGYNTNLIKVLIIFNVLLIIICGCMAYNFSQAKYISNDRFNFLNQKIYDIEMKLINSSQRGQTINSRDMLQHIELVGQNLKTYNAQAKTLQRQLKIIKAVIEQLTESDEQQWTKIKAEQNKLSQVNRAMNSIMQNLKPIKQYFTSFQAPDLQGFKNKFTQTFSDLKAKLKKTFKYSDQNEDQRQTYDEKQRRTNDL